MSEDAEDAQTYLQYGALGGMNKGLPRFHAKVPLLARIA